MLEILRTLMRLLTLIFMCVASLALAPLGRAEDDARPKTQVSASVQNGFARITFDWPEEVKGTAQVSEGVLVISFDKPFDADTSALSRMLEPYAALVRRDPDGRALRVALKGPVRLKTTNHGIRYAFDLIPPFYKGDPPAVPAPAGTKVQSELLVRVTEREKTTRLQFDFPGRVDHTVKASGSKLLVTFSKPAKVDLRRFSQNPPTWVRSARSFREDNKLVIEFEIDREAEFRDVSQNDEIAILLKEPKTDGDAITESAGAAGPPKVLVSNEETNVPPPPRIVAEEIELERPKRKGVATADASAGKDAATGSPKGIRALSDASIMQDAAQKIADAEVPESAATELQPDPLPPALRLGQSDLTAALAPLPSASPVIPGKARAEIFGSMVRLELPYAKLPAAAVFRRGLAIWVVTETSSPMDLSALSELPNAPARLLSSVTEVAPGITAFRLAAPVSMSMSVSAAGNSWVLAIGNTVPELPERLQLIRQTTGPSTKMRATMPGATQVVWLKDPDAQDRIAVVMGYAPARGLLDGRRFVEFAALPSRQGLAVQAIADDLAVSIEGNDAVISRPSGLNVSSTQFVEAPKQSAPATSDALSLAAVDFTAWGQNKGATRSETISKLILESSKSAGGMSGPRMALARFYVANGFGAEALGVLRSITHDDRTAETNVPFRVVRALANIQMARNKEAIADLSIEALGDDAHAALWRGIAAAGARDWRLARNNLIVSLKVISKYPEEWQARARAGLGLSALELGDSAAAKLALEGMPEKNVSDATKANVALVKALTDVALQKRDQAITQLDALAKSPIRPVAARATLESTLLKIAAGTLDAKQAIDSLERLRFQWRGDEVELRTLSELGKLYVEQNKLREGLNTMRLAVRHFSDSDDARQTAAQMSSIFESLFLGERAEKLSPVQALSLFYDYKELTPVGAQGDEMIRKLVERLVAVDLLPQAAELLQHQVDNRLEGIAKAAVAARLAVIYIIDKQPSKALETLRSTRQARLPDELIQQRELIEARALADTKAYNQALDLIASNLGEEADHLRADIYWDAQRWPDAAAKAEALLGSRYAGEGSLTDVQRMDLMRACVAYSLAGDAASLERLRTRYTPKMMNTPDAKAFVMLTNAPDVSSEDYRTFVKRLASVDTLDAFLADFKSKSASAPATATN
jgi:hypothetical protein